MCGAVKFTIRDLGSKFGACHCEMCRQWTGSALLGITVPVANMTFSGAENIAKLQSSEWAERAWCSKCGTGLYYRVTMDGPMSENYEVPIGILDDANGLTLVREIFTDCKPDAFAYQGEHKMMTKAEVLELYGVNTDGDQQ